MVDLFISEALLAKLEERTATASEVGPWPGSSDLEDAEGQLREPQAAWHGKKISNSLFFEEAGRLEAEIIRLNRERQQHQAAAQRAKTDITDIRRRWYSDTNDDRLDMSQKRGYVREAFHAIIVHPVGSGNGSRGKFDPDKLEPIWREG
ncbi:hypothetical protein AB0B89_18600 [Sphaerisporangium sp. NPDC049002]|uniref:hypothetical protein n=1 Tax=unclassified Sphaerisporangium TaxID=2630420 RepID=UPI0033F6D6AD